MRRATDDDYDRIIKYLKTNVTECLYLYIDLTVYGLNNDQICVWIEDEKELQFVAMKYYNGFQLYGHKTPDNKMADKIVDLLNSDPASVILGRKDIIDCISRKMTGYSCSFGSVYRIKDCIDIDQIDTSEVIRATVNDAKDIAELICSNEGLGGYYSIEGLTRQLIDRINSGMGRSFVIRRDNRITAHIATYAETDELAIISGAIVSPQYRNTDDFFKVRSCLLQSLKEDNKEPYAFANDKRIIRFHDRVHEKCGEYGKLERMIHEE